MVTQNDLPFLSKEAALSAEREEAAHDTQNNF